MIASAVADAGVYEIEHSPLANVQVEGASVPLPPAEKETLPPGVDADPLELSLTEAVQVVAVPAVVGSQARIVEVERRPAAIAVWPLLGDDVGSPP